MFRFYQLETRHPPRVFRSSSQQMSTLQQTVSAGADKK